MMKKTNRKSTHAPWKPAQIIAVSFATIIVTGTLLLMLPACTVQGKNTGFLDALFTATSATCVTGLVTVDTATHWSVLGQCIILLMIQIGGLGLVTFTTFFNLLLGKKLGLRSRALAQEAISSDSSENVVPLVRMIIKVSLLIELIGALMLCTVFVPKYGVKGIYFSMFLAISAFCNAGMDPLGFEEPFISLVNYSSSPTVLITVMLLIMVGGLGFLVWSDIYRYHKTRTVSLHSRVVLIFSLMLIVFGTAGVLLLEWGNNATIGGMSLPQKLLNSMFQSVTARTAGFNSFDIAAMNGTTKVMFCFLMFIGACPGSTGGGIKVTTFAVIIMTVWCVVHGEDETVIFGRRVERDTVYKALAILIISLFTVGICCGVMMQTLTLTHVASGGLDVFFEAISAFATVGLSSGVTAIASIPAKFMLILTMYLGRVGPVSFALALSMRPPKQKNIVIPMGKVIVG